MYSICGRQFDLEVWTPEGFNERRCARGELKREKESGGQTIFNRINAYRLSIVRRWIYCLLFCCPIKGRIL